jgi:hypothetical protein
MYILTTTKYFTWWMKEILLTKVNEEVVIIFSEQHIITRFGVLATLFFDNATCLCSLKLTEFTL